MTMTREAMTEMVSETICVTREEAQAALEACDWNVLDAGQMLLRYHGPEERTDRVSLGAPRSICRFFTHPAAVIQ